MRKLSAAEKAEKLLKNDSIFLFGKSKNTEYWIVRGSRGNKYTINYNSSKNSYDCDCKNIRFVDCSHIIAVKKFKQRGKKNELV